MAKNKTEVEEEKPFDYQSDPDKLFDEMRVYFDRRIENAPNDVERSLAVNAKQALADYQTGVAQWCRIHDRG